MSVGVIIPFYNAKKYLNEAIESCLIQEHVSQIILVNDGSADSSFSIAQYFASKNPRIALINHKTNLGRAQARNSGLKKISTPYVSFLDADDYYLHGRFIEPIQFLNAHEDIDGAFEPVASKFERAAGMQHYPSITGIADRVTPDALFEYLVLGKGNFSLIGCTFRTSSIRDFSFDQSFPIGEDTDFIWRIAYNKNIEQFRSTPRVVRRVHGENTFFNTELTNSGRYYYYRSWKERLTDYNMSSAMKKKIISSYAYYKSLASSYPKIFKSFYQRYTQTTELIMRPSLWFSFIRNG